MIKMGRQIASLRKGNFHIELARYLLSGGLATFAHWLIMALLVIAGSTAVLATAIGALAGAMLNYILQRKMTFQSTVAHRLALPRYLGVCVLIWLLNLLLFIGLHRMLQISSVEAQGLTTFLVALMSYFLYRNVVFNDR